METGQPIPDYPRSFLTSFPRAMLEDLAMGLDDDDTIAERYGATLENVTLVRSHPSTRLELELMRQELEKNGRTFRFKNANMAHVTLDRLFRIATDPDTPTSTLLQIHDRFTKHGELEPKPNQAINTQTQEKFQINIVMGSQTVSLGAPDQAAAIYGAEAKPQPAYCAEAGSILPDDLPALTSTTPAHTPPAYLIRAAMQVNAELIDHTPA